MTSQQDEQDRPVPRALVAGATGRLGERTCLGLARRGADLVLLARCPERAEATAKRVRDAAAHAGADIEVAVHLADLSLLAEAERVGDEIVAAHPRIDIVIHHAELRTDIAQTTPEGLPDLVTVNYLAPWVLTDRLIPALRRAEHARVITIGPWSTDPPAELTLPEDLIDADWLTRRRPHGLYAASKLLDVMFSQELARRRADIGLRAICVDPAAASGWGLWALADPRRWSVPPFGGDRRNLAAVATLVVAAALEPRFADVNGGLVSEQATPVHPPRPADDSALRRRLWEVTEAVTAH